MKVLIACGGTGGHLFPGLSLYQALKKENSKLNILLALDSRGVFSAVPGGPFPYIRICASSLKLKFNTEGLKSVFKLIKGAFQSLHIILSFRPDIVVGFGGYASFFLVFFAHAFKIKTVIHEANVTPGKSNRMLARFADKIAVSFDATQEAFSKFASRVRFIGNPLKPGLTRRKKQEAYDFFKLEEDKFTILVTGGSQGAEKINQAFLKAVLELKGILDFQVIHLCGNKGESSLRQSYKQAGIEARVFSFLAKMEYAYSVADIVISRSGAGSINECAFFGLPVIFIPYRFAGRHQIENALYLEKRKAAVLLKEEDSQSSQLKDQILSLFNNQELRKTMGYNILNVSVADADTQLAKLVLYG